MGPKLTCLLCACLGRLFFFFPWAWFIWVQVCLLGCTSCFVGVSAMAALVSVRVSAALVPRGAPFED